MPAEPGAPLAGRTVLVTRPTGRADPLVARLVALGAVVELRPTIAFEAAPRGADVRAAVEALDRYDWVVFTSPTGVRFFRAAVDATGVPDAVLRDGSTRIAAIGPGTAVALERAGLPGALVPDDPRSEGLADALTRAGVSGCRVLLVRPEQARAVLPEALRSAGARVDAVAFYRTVPDRSAGATAALIVEGRYDLVVLTSPSTYRLLLEAAGEGAGPCLRALGSVRRVAIGPVTAAALAGDGLAPHAVAASPDVEGVLAAVCEAARD